MCTRCITSDQADSEQRLLLLLLLLLHIGPTSETSFCTSNHTGKSLGSTWNDTHCLLHFALTFNSIDRWFSRQFAIRSLKVLVTLTVVCTTGGFAVLTASLQRTKSTSIPNVDAAKARVALLTIANSSRRRKMVPCLTNKASSGNAGNNVVASRKNGMSTGL